MTKRLYTPYAVLDKKATELGEALDDQWPAMEAEYPRAWAHRHLTTEEGRPLQWADRPWLADIWDDDFHNQVHMKSAQSGMSTWAMIRVMHGSLFRNETSVYTMPNLPDLGTLVTRLDTIVDNSPYLRRRTGWKGRQEGHRKPLPDAGGLKNFGGANIYFVPTTSRHYATSIPVKARYHDEVDISDPEVLEMFTYRQNRLDLAPEDKITHRFSTPTAENYGIHDLYEHSDKRVWMIRCPMCGWEGELDWDMHTKSGQLDHLECQCGRELDPLENAIGWVAHFPSRSNICHGYHTSRLMTATRTRMGRSVLFEIAERFRTTRYKHLVWNMDLGVPSVEGTKRLTEAIIRNAAFQFPPYGFSIAAQPGTSPYFGGIDQGNELQVVILRRDPHLDVLPDGRQGFRVMFLARLKDPSKGSRSWDEAGRIITRFGCRMTVVDGMPNVAPAHDLAAAFPYKVRCAYYSDNQRTEIAVSGDLKKRERRERRGAVSVDEHVDISLHRTETLDNTYEAVSSGLIQLPGLEPYNTEVQAWINHICNDVRKPWEDKRTGQITYGWWKGPGANDYFHATNYAMAAAQEFDRIMTDGRRNRFAPSQGLG